MEGASLIVNGMRFQTEGEAELKALSPMTLLSAGTLSLQRELDLSERAGW